MGEGPIRAAQMCTINKYQNELYNYLIGKVFAELSSESDRLPVSPFPLLQ